MLAEEVWRKKNEGVGGDETDNLIFASVGRQLYLHPKTWNQTLWCF